MQQPSGSGGIKERQKKLRCEIKCYSTDGGLDCPSGLALAEDYRKVNKINAKNIYVYEYKMNRERENKKGQNRQKKK